MGGGDPQTDLDEAFRRRVFYGDIETLLERGYLTAPIRLGDSVVVLRTVSSEVNERIVNLSSRVDDWKRWFLAYAVWMVDGLDVTVFPNAPYHIHRWWLKDLHVKYVDALLASLRGLNKRIERAMLALEAYCYEPYSRSKWRTRDRTRSPPGNVVYQNWAAYNLGEDKRIQDESSWAQTQIIVSALSSKGGKHIREHFNRVEERETLRRTEVIEDTINRIISGAERATEMEILVNGERRSIPVPKMARTVADLEEEMRKTIEGDLDAHDLAVEDYERRVREAVARRRERAAAARDRKAKLDEMLGQAGIQGSTDLVGTPVAPGGPRRTSTISTSSDAERLFERYVERGRQVGVLGPKGVPIALENDGKAKKEPLQQRIADRRPSLTSSIGDAGVRGRDA